MIGRLLATAAVVALGTTSALAETPTWQLGARVLGVIPSEDATITPIGGDVDIDNSLVPELDLTYHFDPNWAVEVIAATTPHDVEHTAGVDLGSVWLLPPTVLLQYHFMPESESFRPYVGVGVNYTIFYNVDEPAGLNIDYDNSWGFALQAGFELPINDKWSFNFDVKKLWLDTDVTITGLGPVVEADVDIDPWIVGVGFRFAFD